MKKFLSLISIIFFGFALYAQTTKVLFIGNSYTAVNNLPAMFHDIALAGGDSVFADSNAPGGYTFQMHSTDANTLAKINQQPWDYVVLQEQSQLPAFPQFMVDSLTIPFAGTLDSLIHANDSCGQTVFYMTWGRRYGDPSNCGQVPYFCTFDSMSQRLRETYLQLGTIFSASVAPAGAAWSNSIHTDSTVVLHMADNSHPSVEGTYLTACIFYATIFRKNPVGINFYSTLDTATAQYLQGIAKQTVTDSLYNWNINKAQFTYTQNQSSFQFNATNEGKNYFWDFGDGVTDTAQQPQHTFGPGIFTVTHIVNTACSSDTVTILINIAPFSVPEFEDTNRFSIYPNPSNGSFSIRMNENISGHVTFKVFDVTGRIISDKDYPVKELNNYALNFKLSPGIYFLQLETKKGLSQQRIIVAE